MNSSWAHFSYSQNTERGQILFTWKTCDSKLCATCYIRIYDNTLQRFKSSGRRAVILGHLLFYRQQWPGVNYRNRVGFYFRSGLHYREVYNLIVNICHIRKIEGVLLRSRLVLDSSDIRCMYPIRRRVSLGCAASASDGLRQTMAWHWRAHAKDLTKN